MIIKFAELINYNFELSDINIIYQKPSYRKLNITNRIPNGFLVITKGCCTYTWDGNSARLTPDSIIYLPKCSKHYLAAETDEFEFFRIDFKIKIDNEFVFFSNNPLVVTYSASAECLDAVNTLYTNYQFVNNTVAKSELILKIFRLLLAHSVSKRQNKLTPAVSYLTEHLTEGISCKFLAEKCYLSTAQFYKLFSEEYGCTPLEYRNRLLITRSKTLLETKEFTVSEVSEALGFESAAYFSRFFKKHVGVSPKNYNGAL